MKLMLWMLIAATLIPPVRGIRAMRTAPKEERSTSALIAYTAVSLLATGLLVVFFELEMIF